MEFPFKKHYQSNHAMGLARANMVESQIRVNNIHDEYLLGIMVALPRELFVPENTRQLAYCDAQIKFGHGRAIPSPLTQAQIVTHSDLSEEQNILVVGANYGYLSAIISLLGGCVFTLDDDMGAFKQLSKISTELELDNLVTVKGKMKLGAKKEGPYDRIIIEGKIDTPSSALKAQLKDGGRMVYIANASDTGLGHLKTLTRFNDSYIEKQFSHCPAPIIQDFINPQKFQFVA